MGTTFHELNLSALRESAHNPRQHFNEAQLLELVAAVLAADLGAGRQALITRYTLDEQRTSPGWRPNGVMAPLKGRRVLLVEDDPDVRIMTAAQLKQLGYKVHAVANGNEAIDWIAELAKIRAETLPDGSRRIDRGHADPADGPRRSDQRPPPPRRHRALTDCPHRVTSSDSASRNSSRTGPCTWRRCA